MNGRKIYLASSWRNERQPEVVNALRAAGHLVYDFRNPPSGAGFEWAVIDPGWQDWSPSAFRDALDHDAAQAGYSNDFEAMQWADTCVLLLPCGRSAHMEAGWMAGAGKQVFILLTAKEEPELMYRMANGICLSVGELLARLHR